VTGVADQQALEPLRNALLARAQADAAACVTRTRTETAAELAAARIEADRTAREARHRGEAEAAAMVTIDDALARRHVHTVMLAARRSVYDQLRLRVRAEVGQLHGEPVYGDLRDTMTRAGRSLIGPDASARDIADGCVVEASGRRVEVTLGALADWALDAVLADSPELTP
jgi:hypothetical protein